MVVGAAVGRHRRRPQGHPRRQRGDLDDHAQRDRDDPGRLPPQHLRREGRQLAAHHRARGGQPARRAGRRSSTATAPIWTLAILAVLRGRRLLVPAQPTSFGFDLRATGMSETAAVASGVKVEPDGRHLDDALRRGRRPDLDAGALRRRPTPTAPSSRPGLGFTGIAVALLGRNQPLGILFGAVLFAFLNEQSNRLTLQTDISQNVVQITQGVIVLAVVVAYEVVRRRRVAAEQRAVGRQLDADKPHRTRRCRHEHPRHRAGSPTAQRQVRSPLHLAADRPLGAIAAVSLVRVITGEHEIDSAGTLRAAIIATCPILMAALGGLWTERAGVVNIGLEGQMILGTWGAAYFTYYYGPWVGILGAALLGAIGGALHALATVTFGVDHIVSGVAINIIGARRGEVPRRGLLRRPRGRRRQAAHRPRPTTEHHHPRALRRGSTSLADKHWFVVSDLASCVAALTTQPQRADAADLRAGRRSRRWILWRTAFGLRLRSCGENPQAAESLGVNVLRYKYIAVVVSGALRRHRRRLPRPGRLQRLRHRPDRRSRLHRPRRDDLRQLAARRHPRRRADVRLHRQPAAAVDRHRPRAAAARRDRPARAGRLAALRGKQTTQAIVFGVLGAAVPAVVPAHRRGAARVHRHDALRRHAAGPGLRAPNGCACPRPTARSTARAVPGER